MFLFALRRLPLTLLALALALAFAGRAGAELVWTPQGGWKVEGGALAGVGGQDARKALELMNKARTAEEAGRSKSAINLYKKVAKRYANSLYAPEAQYRMGNLWYARKAYINAFEAYQIAATRYPNSGRYNELVGKQYQIASLMVDGARGRLLWGLLPGFTNREKAIGFFEVILIEAPYSDYAPLSLMSIARAHQRFGNTEEAIDALDRMINSYPQSVLAADAYLTLAQTHASLVHGAYYDQGSTRDSITYYEDFMILFPSDNNVASAEKGLTAMKHTLAESKMKIGDFYFYKRDNFKAARVFYNEAITVYPDSDVAIKARDRLAEVDKAAAAANNTQPKKKRFFFF